MWLLNTWESLQSAFPYFGFNSFFWVRKRKEKSRSATFQQGRSYSAAPIHGRGPLGATQSQTPRWKLAVGHWDVSSATGGCLNIWEPPSACGDSLWQFPEKDLWAEPLPWGESMMLQDVMTGTLGSQHPQKKFKDRRAKINKQHCSRLGGPLESRLMLRTECRQFDDVHSPV